jgi:ABC-type sulfate transport system substrate-binding protein
VPDQTLLIETPAAVTKDAPPAAKSFLDYLYTPEAQEEFLKSGYRPVVEGVTGDVAGATDPANPFPAPKVLLTIDKDFGGWAAAKDRFFDEENGIVSKIQAATGTTGDQ